MAGSRRPRRGHPCRQQRQRPIRLPDDEMFGTGMVLRTDHHDHLTAARMKRILNPNLKRRTPGSMTLLRLVAVGSLGNLCDERCLSG